MVSIMHNGPADIQQFQQYIWQFYKDYGRSFAWRNIENPYYIMVSEIMLQQTQTHRVVPKFEEFIASFPTIQDLASADLKDVFRVWQGLGYNRRAKALWENAQRLMADFDAQVPSEPGILETFAHVGPNTACSIAAFAFNKPVVFIETNIRTVYLYVFFKNISQVPDKELFPLIERTLDITNPREWYYALMDYGSYLKRLMPNPSRNSTHYTVQSKFEGSNRQIRGRIISLLTRFDAISKQDLFSHLGDDHIKYEAILSALIDEKMVKISENKVSI